MAAFARDAVKSGIKSTLGTDASAPNAAKNAMKNMLGMAASVQNAAKNGMKNLLGMDASAPNAEKGEMRSTLGMVASVKSVEIDGTPNIVGSRIIRAIIRQPSGALAAEKCETKGITVPNAILLIRCMSPLGPASTSPAAVQWTISSTSLQNSPAPDTLAAFAIIKPSPYAPISGHTIMNRRSMVRNNSKCHDSFVLPFDLRVSTRSMANRQKQQKSGHSPLFCLI